MSEKASLFVDFPVLIKVAHRVAESVRARKREDRLAILSTVFNVVVETGRCDPDEIFEIATKRLAPIPEERTVRR